MSESKTIMLTLAEPNALLVSLMDEVVPYAGLYDGLPYLETVLEDVFLGRPLNHDLMPLDILMLEGMTPDEAQRIHHQVSLSVVDSVTGFMPWLSNANHGYHFKVHNNFDLEITIPAYSVAAPGPTQDALFEIIEEVREADAKN